MCNRNFTPRTAFHDTNFHRRPASFAIAEYLSEVRHTYFMGTAGVYPPVPEKSK